MLSSESHESAELTPDQIKTRENIRRSLARNSSSKAHYDSDDGHFRHLLLKDMPGRNREEEEELHFRNLMSAQKKT